MNSQASRPGFSLEALIAEAKRRARQRRLLVAALLLAVAVAVLAVVLGSPGGGGSRSGGSAGGVGSASDGSQSVQVGAFALTVPRGFYQTTIPCPIRHCRLGDSPIRVLVSNRPFTPTSSQIYPANRVVLDLGYLSPAPGVLATQRLPLDLHKLQLMGHRPFGDGTSWAGSVSGGGSVYQLWVFEGRKTSPADRASVLRALRSIHQAH
jgi:hypothetical protein